MRHVGLLKAIERVPILGTTLLRLLACLRRAQFQSSSSYWENRYTRGGSSGLGSFGSYASFKANVVNAFVNEHRVTSIIEFGCGDGNQLSLMQYPRYIGLDVSSAALDRCRKLFAGDNTKSFFLYEPQHFLHSRVPFSAELAMSLDVIYHLVEDDVFEKYLTHLFAVATRYVIIFSSDTDVDPGYLAPHVKHRRFSQAVARNFPDWKLLQTIPNEIARHDTKIVAGTAADFYIYAKQ